MTAIVWQKFDGRRMDVVCVSGRSDMAITLGEDGGRRGRRIGVEKQRATQRAFARVPRIRMDLQGVAGAARENFCAGKSLTIAHSLLLAGSSDTTAL